MARRESMWWSIGELAIVAIAATAVMAIIATLGGCAGTFGGPTRRGILADRDPALEVAWGVVTALAVCDTAGTVWFGHDGKYDRQDEPGFVLVESDPLLTNMPGVGQTPRAKVLWAGNITLNSLNYLATRAPVPKWMRWAWFGLLAGVETAMIARNAPYVGACGLAWQKDMPTSTSAARR